MLNDKHVLCDQLRFDLILLYFFLIKPHENFRCIRLKCVHESQKCGTNRNANFAQYFLWNLACFLQ